MQKDAVGCPGFIDDDGVCRIGASLTELGPLFRRYCTPGLASLPESGRLTIEPEHTDCAAAIRSLEIISEDDESVYAAPDGVWPLRAAWHTSADSTTPARRLRVELTGPAALISSLRPD